MPSSDPLHQLGCLKKCATEYAGERIPAFTCTFPRHPDSIQAWYALAQAHAALGNGPEACRALDQFLSLSPPPEWAEQAGKVKGQLECP